MLCLAVLAISALDARRARGPRPVDPGSRLRRASGILSPGSTLKGSELPDETNASGEVLVLAAGSGSTSCTEDGGTVFLELAWPPGRRLDWTAGYDEDDTQRYMRETEGSLIATEGQSDLAAILPAADRFTGFTRTATPCTPSLHKPSAVWVQRSDQRVERWARTRPGDGCA